MAIAIGNNTTGDSGSAGGTFDAVMPTGANGSSITLVIISSANDVGTAIGSWTLPAGWTQIAIDTITGTTRPQCLQAAWSLGNNTNLTFTKSGSVKYLGWKVIDFTGVDLTTPIDATGTSNNNTGLGTITANAVTIITDQAWHLIAADDWNVAGGTISAPSFSSLQSVGPDASACLLYNSTPKAPGSTGTVVVTGTGGTDANNAMNAIPFALRPTSTGGGGILYINNLFRDIFSSSIINGIQ